MYKNSKHGATLSGGDMPPEQKKQAEILISLFEDRLDSHIQLSPVPRRYIRPFLNGHVMCGSYGDIFFVGYHPAIGMPTINFHLLKGSGPPSSYAYHHFLYEQTGFDFAIVSLDKDILAKNEVDQRREMDAIVLNLVCSELARMEVNTTVIPNNPIFGANVFPIQPELVFVLMPFQKELTDIYDAIIKPTVEKKNLIARRADDITSNNAIIADIWKSICEARFILADTTGLNPNVMYELGIAHTVGKETIIIFQQNGNQNKYPFDIAHMRRIGYQNTVTGAASLQRQLEGTIDHVLEKMEGNISAK